MQNIFHAKQLFIRSTVGDLEPKNKKYGYTCPTVVRFRQADFKEFLRGDSRVGPEHFCAENFLQDFFYQVIFYIAPDHQPAILLLLAFQHQNDLKSACAGPLARRQAFRFRKACQ